MDYHPRPIDTSQIELPPDVVALVELLARNVHDRWADHRLAEGWRYGHERDEIHKKTPNLVPYDELPESEKICDRDSVMETLKVLMALGYRIEKSC